MESRLSKFCLPWFEKLDQWCHVLVVKYNKGLSHYHIYCRRHLRLEFSKAAFLTMSQNILQISSYHHLGKELVGNMILIKNEKIWCRVSDDFRGDRNWLVCISNKVLNNGPSKICGRQPLKNLTGYGLLLVHSWLLCPIYRFDVRRKMWRQSSSASHHKRILMYFRKNPEQRSQSYWSKFGWKIDI